MWHEIAVMSAAETIDQGYPHFSVRFKIFELIRVNGITQVAGNHLDLQYRIIQRRAQQNNWLLYRIRGTIVLNY